MWHFHNFTWHDTYCRRSATNIGTLPGGSILYHIILCMNNILIQICMYNSTLMKSSEHAHGLWTYWPPVINCHPILSSFSQVYITYIGIYLILTPFHQKYALLICENIDSYGWSPWWTLFHLLYMLCLDVYIYMHVDNLQVHAYGDWKRPVCLEIVLQFTDVSMSLAQRYMVLKHFCWY